MKKSWQNNTKKIFLIGMAVLMLLQLCILFYYGSKKSGFHEDEMYTYYSSNKTAGLFVNDRQWISGEELRSELVVLPGEQFRYSVVKQMQSWDVHPPLYYYIFHTACSLFPGVFSKWLGIGINMIAYVVCFVLLGYASYTVMTVGDQEGHPQESAMALSFVTCLAWGFCPAVISGVMFIRMYQWLTLFILLCLCLHLRAMKKQDFRMGSFLLPVTATMFLGFSTQYYYIIFHFFLGTGFCFWLLWKKKIKELFAYVVFCAIGLGGAISYYPACMAHIFRGYRGTEAVSEFGDVSNTWGRLRFFTGLFDDYVMNGMLAVFLLIICLLWLTVWYQRKRKAMTEAVTEARRAVTETGFDAAQAVGLMLFACAGYFFTISKTALLLGETSNRYQLPIYGILLFLLLYFVTAPIFSVLKETKKGQQIVCLVLAVVFLCSNGLALKNHKVFFLYEEDAVMLELVKENKDVPVVVCYHDSSPDNIWRLSGELIEYSQIYLVSLGNAAPIEEKEITESDRLLVFAADYDRQAERLAELFSANAHLTDGRVAAKKGLWTLYELWSEEP